MTLVPATTVPVPEVELPASIPTELVVTELTPARARRRPGRHRVRQLRRACAARTAPSSTPTTAGTRSRSLLGAGGVIDGWDQGLVGATAGSALQLDIPADLAYGDAPPGDVIQAGRRAVVRRRRPRRRPARRIAADAPTAEQFPLSAELVTEPVAEDLVVGDGATLEAGQTGVFQLIAARGDTARSSRARGRPGSRRRSSSTEGQLLDGLVEGLPGMQVGGRRAITIPYDPTWA